MELRSARKGDFKGVVDLINSVFRETRGYEPTMQEEFPLLLNEGNVENMMGIYQDGKPVSEINFLKEDIFIEGTVIKAASIGGVCTQKDFRERNYASLILDKVEEKMYKDGVDVVLISGERSLYTRRECVKVKNFLEYTIYPCKTSCNNESNIHIELQEYSEKYLQQIVKMYNLNSTRYYRTYDEFKTLLESSTFPWGTYTYKKYVLIRENILCGYIIMRIINEEENWAQVIECFGNPHYIYKALSEIGRNSNLKYIKHYVHVKDSINKLENCNEVKLDYLHGTVKIINFLSLMEHLKPYFSQYLSKNIFDKVKFIEDENGWSINIEDEILSIDSKGTMTRLVFQGIDKCTLGINLNGKPKIEKFIKAVFPIPFISTANLNYQ